jgi:hypothetical protein
VAFAFEDMNSVLEDMELNANVFFKTFDFEAFSIVGFDLILNIAFGATRGVVVELTGNEVVSVAFGLKVFSFRTMVFTIIVSEDTGFDVYVSSTVSSNSPCDDTTSDEASSAEHGAEDLVSSEAASSDIVSSDIVSVDIISPDTVSESVDSEDVSENIVSKNITLDDISNDIPSQFIDLSRNPGSGLGAIECGVIAIECVVIARGQQTSLYSGGIESVVPVRGVHESRGNNISK